MDDEMGFPIFFLIMIAVLVGVGVFGNGIGKRYFPDSRILEIRDIQNAERYCRGVGVDTVDEIQVNVHWIRVTCGDEKFSLSKLEINDA